MRIIKRLLIILICVLACWVFNSNNSYMTTKPYTVETVQIYSGTSSGRNSHLEFIGVFRTADGILFDRVLSASFYSQVAVGDKITMYLRPMDVKQTGLDNTVWFFGQVILFSVSFVVIIMNLVAICFPKFLDDLK